MDNAKRFAKEGWGRVQEDSISGKAQEKYTQLKSVEWTMEMKVTLVQIENEEGQRERDYFMKTVKERWVCEYPEHTTANIQKLLDNAVRFRKEQTIANRILVQQRNEVENNIQGNQKD